MKQAVKGQTLNIKVIFSKDLGTLVNRFTGAVKDTTQHVFRDRDTEGITSEFDTGILDIDTRSTFKDLFRLSFILETTGRHT